MSAKPFSLPNLPVSKLNKTGPTPFLIEPDTGKRSLLAEELGALAIKKLRFAGEITPQGRDGWHLSADLGATVAQACIVTLDPVTTRIDTKVSRTFLPPHRIEQPDAGSETEMPQEDDIEELGEEIDLDTILAESLSLALPTYPRKDGAEMETAQFAAQGVAPMRDEDARPFAGLAGLREKMQKDSEEE